MFKETSVGKHFKNDDSTLFFRVLSFCKNPRHSLHKYRTVLLEVYLSKEVTRIELQDPGNLGKGYVEISKEEFEEKYQTAVNALNRIFGL